MWFPPSWPIESLTRKDDVAPSQKTPAPFPRPLLKRLLVSILWAGYAQAEDLSTLWHKKKSTILHQCTQVWLSILLAPSGYPITAKIYATVDSVNGHTPVIFVWFYSLFLVNSFINLGQLTPIVWEGFPRICRGQHRSPFPSKGAAPSDTDARKCHRRWVSALQASALPGGRETAR